MAFLSKIVSYCSLLIQPAPFIEPIQDNDEIKEQYTYWRRRLFYSMFIAYSLFYFTRKSFVFLMPELQESLGFSKEQLGWLTTILALSYGMSKFVSGILADQSNPRFFLPTGLIITGIINICFGLSSSLLVFTILWGLNGWFQGFGWPPIARLLSHWYARPERGTWWSITSTSHNVGGAIIPLLVTFVVSLYGWRWGMHVPGIICILAGFWLFNRLRDTPQSLGLPSADEYYQHLKNIDSAQFSNKVKAQSKLTTKEILFKYVLLNQYIWILAIAYLFVYIIRSAVNDWTVFYLKEVKNYSATLAGSTIFTFEMGGLVGMLAAGSLSDYLFKGKRGPVLLLYSILTTISLSLFWIIPPGHFFLDSAIIALNGFAIFGPQMLIGLTASEYAHKNAAATANGFVGWFGYVGAAGAGMPLGYITDQYGWDAYFYVIIGASILTILCIIPFCIPNSKIQSESLATAC